MLAVPGKNRRASFSLSGTLRTNFDHIIAVDTNNREYGDKRLSFCFAYVVPQALENFSEQIQFIPLGGYVLNQVASDINPETLGWYLFLSRHCSTTGLRSSRLAVVVDSELGQLAAMNDRTVPYFQNEFLPEFATLVYASDAATDTFLNQMIKYCHNAANAAADQFEKKGLVGELLSLKTSVKGCLGHAYFRGKAA